MKPYCIFITCLVLFTFCSLTQSEFSQGPDKCCFSYINVQIPVKQIESYHITRPECHKCGIIIITKDQREICADPTERWVKRLMNFADLHALHRCNEHERPFARSDVGTEAKKASQSVIMTETIPLHRPEETTLVLFKESHDWKASELLRTTETTPLHRLEEMCLVRFKESHDRYTHFCMRPG